MDVRQNMYAANIPPVNRRILLHTRLLLRGVYFHSRPHLLSGSVASPHRWPMASDQNSGRIRRLASGAGETTTEPSPNF